ncbi:MAG: hypothetical protein FWF41_05270 [Betaproteobacteria bacterium]|nr:hypothetical protein [Betaproteobacteria bacterium]
MQRNEKPPPLPFPSPTPLGRMRRAVPYAVVIVAAVASLSTLRGILSRWREGQKKQRFQSKTPQKQIINNL